MNLVDRILADPSVDPAKKNQLRGSAAPSIKQAHVDLIARLAGIDVPRIPIGVQSQDILALGLYASVMLENYRRHMREVIAVAKENGVSGAGEVGKDADAVLADLQSEFLGVFGNAAERMTP